MVPKGGGGRWNVGSSDPTELEKPLMIGIFLLLL